jgi:hypothetical protein
MIFAPSASNPWQSGRTRRAVEWLLAGSLLLLAIGLLPATGHAQQAPPPAAKGTAPGAAPAPPNSEDDELLPGDWGPALLYGIVSSPNGEAESALLRAAFAAGPAIIPQLTEALKDDRTAEFAAQSLAYIGGNDALPVLSKLLSDPRDLNLRRFTYGALAEFDTPEATDLLFDAINKSDNEPDRTVTESAVIALTVRTDTSLLPRLAAAGKKLQDVVIRDDLENARTVIEERAKYLASSAGKKSGVSVEAAVRTYFIPALEPLEPAPGPTARPVPGKPGAAKPPVHVSAPPRPAVSVDVRSVTLSPDGTRALAQVVFEDPTAMAYYDFVLVKHLGDWTLASVWLGPEVEKPGARTQNPDSNDPQ